MTYLVGLPDGEDMLVFEVDRTEVSDDLVLASQASGIVADRARVTLDDALSKLKPSMQKVIHALRAMSPDEASVEFGLKVGGETGLIVAKGTAEVNFIVRMSWRRADAPAEQTFGVRAVPG